MLADLEASETEPLYLTTDATYEQIRTPRSAEFHDVLSSL